MACLFIDGFDKYGPPNSNATNVTALVAGDWTAAGTGVAIVAGLSAVGYAFSVGAVSAAVSITRTLAANYTRLIAGFRFSSNLSSNNTGLAFLDVGTTQCSVRINTTGTISVVTGAVTGTVVATSTATVAANSVHYLEVDFTFSATGAYQVWLDGVSILSGTGNLHTTANNYANSVQFITSTITQTLIVDDFYLFDTTGTANNAALLTSPRVETTFPVSDGTVQFAIGAATIGSPIARTSSNNVLAANLLYLRPVTAARAMTLNTLYWLPNSAVSMNYTMVIYGDSSGVPGALLGHSNSINVTTVAGTAASGTLVTPVALTGGVQYWIGLMWDTAPAIQAQDTLALSRSVSVTYGSGPPSTAPGMTGAQATLPCWGAVSSTGANYYEVSQQPAASQYSYVFDSTVGHEDLYNFNNLSVIPTSIYAVSVKAWAAKSDTGARTFSIRTLSGGVDSGGTVTGQALATTYQWYDTMFENDPGTSAAWTGANLNAAQSGFRIDS